MSQTVQKQQQSENNIEREETPSWSELTSRFKNNVFGKQYPLFHLVTILLVNSTILLGASLLTLPASIFYFYIAVDDSSTKTTNLISNIGTTILLALTCIWYPTIGSNIILGLAGFLIYWKLKNESAIL